jgi:serine/threonine-protein kinase
VPQFRERLLTSRDRANVLDQAQEYRDLIGAALVLVTNRDGILLARTDYPEEYDRDLSHGALIATALSGEQTSGAFSDDRDTAAIRLYVAVATPLAARGAAPQGVLVAAYALDDSLAASLKQATNSDVVFFAFRRDNVPVVVGSTAPRTEVGTALAAGLHPEALSDTAATRMAAIMHGEHLIGVAAPIRSAGGDVYGGVLALRSRDAELAAFRALQRTIVLAIGLGVVLALAFAFVQARQIAGPVRRLALATRRVQEGDYAVAIDVSTSDEIGVLARAFKDLVEDLKEKSDLVEYMMRASGAAATQPISGAATGRPAIASGGDALRPGSTFAGRYEIKEILGMGGMGVVYRAFDRELQEPVAIKTLRPEALTGNSVALERFKQEIRLARRIAHRNVVRTYDLGEVNGMYYLTMELVEGTSLKLLITSRGRLPVPVTLTVGKQLCRALEVAHAEGVIHRDIKPQNMVVEPSGFLKVMDFGIARLADPPKDKPGGRGLTEAGTTIGTLDYMSPEQLSGAELGARSDLYSAGVVLFECLTGRLPFEADTTWSLIAKHLEEAPPDPRTLNAEVSDALARVVLTAMAKRPEERYRSAAALHDALAAIG